MHLWWLWQYLLHWKNPPNSASLALPHEIPECNRCSPKRRDLPTAVLKAAGVVAPARLRQSRDSWRHSPLPLARVMATKGMAVDVSTFSFLFTKQYIRCCRVYISCQGIGRSKERFSSTCHPIGSLLSSVCCASSCRDAERSLSSASSKCHLTGLFCSSSLFAVSTPPTGANILSIDAVGYYEGNVMF